MKEKSTAIGALLLLATLLNAGALVAADSPSVGGGSDAGGSPVAARPVYPLTVTFSPNPISMPTPGRDVVTIILYNGGSYAFVVKGCKTRITWSTGKTTTGTCHFKGVTVQVGMTYDGTNWIWTLGKNAPLGKSTWVVTVLGYEVLPSGKHVPVQSEPGTQTVNIT